MPSWNEIFDSVQSNNQLKIKRNFSSKNLLSTPVEIVLFIFHVGNKNLALKLHLV